jgi:hypothetical protein
MRRAFYDLCRDFARSHRGRMHLSAQLIDAPLMRRLVILAAIRAAC